MHDHNDTPVTTELAREHGLSPEEFQRIQQILGRMPNLTELGIFSVMWSEHCSYKNSIAQLKTLPRSGGRLLVEAGEENAGLVDIGDGLAVAFKIESHNHPSAVEPYQGAATGVGGIMRDIFTMGARPICSLNSLRFPSPEHPTTRWLVDGIVRGIGDYGNCLGIPTVGGEAAFETCYNGNPLVNAMTVGVVTHSGTASAIACGTGNPVFLMGASTGRDGIHGATFASEELSAESEEKRSNVQVGDPFMEKLLLEATLELIASGDVVGIQDMGAAGITCSCSEMSAKGESGIRIEIAEVPQREPGMSAYEVLLSESQERMLVVMKKGREATVRRICERWDIHCARIGEVTDTGLFEVYHNGELKASVPSHDLVLGGGAPVYIREWREPEEFAVLARPRLEDHACPADLNAVLSMLMAHPNIASKRWIYRQYDHMIGLATTVRPGGDAAVVRVKGSGKSLAVTTDCNSRLVRLDPRAGARAAVAEAARNIACTGARPLAITNCLNFGNPMDPEIYWQFREAIAGMGEACRALDTPVTGGNVSFYNESPAGAVNPTPVIGMVGLLEHDRPVPSAFRGPGDNVFLLGLPRGEAGGSLYFESLHGSLAGQVPDPDLAHEKRLQEFLALAAEQGLLQSAHDVSEGGLAVCLAEACLMDPDRRVGLRARLPFEGRPDGLLFLESPGQVVISVRPARREAIEALAASLKLPCTQLGTTGGERFCVGEWLDQSLDTLAELWWHSLEAFVERRTHHG
ncbi:MAG: phosphoribosylformylglycinamidine synthase subunit PurL [Candidatus Delongbacteria bacterium]|nr:phosphoribosylformylglycinamidine synthase subunit PurL [Candidatus Delongbacteria bacterium]